MGSSGSLALLSTFILVSCLQGSCLDIAINASNFLNTIDIKGHASLLNANYISLTQILGSGKDSVGRAFYHRPVRLLDPDTGNVLSFSTHFVFQIVRFGVPADGMTFLMAPPDHSFDFNARGGYLGFNSDGTNGNESNHLFGIEFDTYTNLEFNDSVFRHVGVNVNSVKSIATFDFNKEIMINLDMNLTLQAWIEYDGDAEQVQVWMAQYASPKPLKPFISTSVSLRNVLLAEMNVGFSAATGTSSELHRVYTWSFHSDEPPPSSSPASAPIAETKTSPDTKTSRTVLVKALVPLTLSITLTGFFLSCWIVRARRRRQSPSPSVSRQVFQFTYRELYAATKGFSSKELLGRGGSCEVYRGYITNTGSFVAVKAMSDTPNHAEAQFLAELSVISTVRHQNLVSLRGWCQEKKKLLLVYEFMAKGSLDRYIFSREPPAILHDGLEQRIVHRDVKAANVLLDENYLPKLGDFGLAKLLEQAQGAQTMTKAGTLGYIAPELAYTGRATEKSDVYSFGVLVLEIITGRQAIDNTTLEVADELESFAEDCPALLDWV